MIPHLLEKNRLNSAKYKRTILRVAAAAVSYQHPKYWMEGSFYAHLVRKRLVIVGR